MVRRAKGSPDESVRKRCEPAIVGAVGEVAGSGTYSFVLVTHERPTGCSETLRSVLQQSVPPTRVVLVDNSPDVTDWETLRPTSEVPIEYLPQTENRGFAGGLAVALARVVEVAEPDEWVMICPDDMPLQDKDFAAHSLRAANAVLALDRYTAAVGRMGAEVDLSVGRIKKWGRSHPGQWEPAIQPVDYISTGPAPLFRVGCFQQAGVFRGDLFIGMTEVEMGVRLRHAGYSLYVLRELPQLRASREMWSEGVARMGSPWREYYSVRNFLTIMREYSTTAKAARFALRHGAIRPIVRLVPRPNREARRRLVMSLRGMRDGWRGRMGRRVEPER